MHPARIAFAACGLFAAPVALLAQSTPPNVRPIPVVTGPHPFPSGGHSQHRSNRYPIVIDGSVLNRYLATPTPAPKHTPAHHQKSNGEDVFETHSTDDAK